MSIEDTVRLYFTEQLKVIEAFPVDVVAKLVATVVSTYEAGGTIYAMANGGNAGTLDHFYCDFTHHPFVTADKHRQLPSTVPRLRFVNLAASPAELTGLANDLGPDEGFAGTLKPFVTAGDLVMAFSGSGNSANAVKALEVAKQAGAATFAMSKGDGGRCARLADLALVVPGSSTFPGQTGKNDNNFHFEDSMMSLNHIIVGLLQRHVARRYGTATPG